MTKKKFLAILNVQSAIACLITGIVLTIQFGFKLSSQNEAFFYKLITYLAIYFIIDIFLRIFIRGPRHLLTHISDLAIFVLFINRFVPLPFSNLVIIQIAMLIIMLGRIVHIHQLFKNLKFKPAQMLIIGFLFCIFIGSILLSLPIATYKSAIPYPDAVFTATSAICVTGLVVNNISKTFTIFGLATIMLLMQIGGLGIMALSVVLARILNRKMSHSETLEFQQTYSTMSTSESWQALKAIFKFTFLFEAVGAGLLFFFWKNDFSSNLYALFASVFHSISAFCNAGFSLFSNSFVDYATNYSIVSVIAFLIIIGGIGFPVIVDLTNRLKNRKIKTPIRLHTKIVLTATFLLLLSGTILILIGEYNGSLAPYSSLGKKSFVAFFQSVTARTAGFNTINLESFKLPTLFFLIILMYIGASPGSTGGGIKTSTASVLFLNAWNTLRSQDKTEISGRTISRENTRKALAIIILSAVLIAFFFYLLLSFEKHSFVKVLFETFSAFGTVGLSLGITKYLSFAGKMIIIVVMFIGRVGPLTLAYALARRKPKINYAYPKENILIA
ncbi:TrkH family potassium uptake protein [Candidatus Margulisiibacteriota bacterium]